MTGGNDDDDDHLNDDTENDTKSPDTNIDVPSDSGATNEEETLQSLLLSSLNANDEELNDVESIAGEFSTLNSTIDELNKFLDRWDERHTRLRVQIREALEEDERDRGGAASTLGKCQAATDESGKGSVDEVAGTSCHKADGARDSKHSDSSHNINPSV